MAGRKAEGSSRLGDAGECTSWGLTTPQGVKGEGEGLKPAEAGLKDCLSSTVEVGEGGINANFVF